MATAYVNFYGAVAGFQRGQQTYLCEASQPHVSEDDVGTLSGAATAYDVVLIPATHNVEIGAIDGDIFFCTAPTGSNQAYIEARGILLKVGMEKSFLRSGIGASDDDYSLYIWAA